MSWSSGFVFKGISLENSNSKNVQSLISMGEDRSFGNIFSLYNFRIFGTIKFATFRKSLGHVLELYEKGKNSLIFQQVQFFTKMSKKPYNFIVPLYGWNLFVSKLQSHYKETVFFVTLSRRSFWYSFDWPRKDKSLSKPGVTQCFWILNS